MKYIIDVPDEGKYRLGQAYIFANDGERLVASCNLTDLTPYTEPDREAIEDEAWEFAWEVLQLDLPVFREIFGHDTDKMDYRDYKYKYETWKKQKDEIHVGDELKQITVSGSPTGAKCIVVKTDGDKMNGIGKDGSLVVCSSQVKRWWRKTGKSFPEVAELLKKMGEE